MTHYIQHTKDFIGNNYLAIDIPVAIIQTFLNELKEYLGEDKYETYTQNQQNRDHGDHHITVVNVMEYNKLSKEMGMDKLVNSLNNVFSYEVDDVKFMGLGTAQRNENITFFVVCNSAKLDALRDAYGLPNQDFHVTLGFNHKDVFGVRKNEVMEKSNNFLKLLSKEFYKNDNWNFVKKIVNYNDDVKAVIIPVKITNSYLKVKIDGNFLDIIWLDDKFWVATKYSADKDLPRLPETEINRIFKKNGN